MTLKGTGEMLRILDLIAIDQRAKAIKGAVTAAGTPIIKSMKATAPVRTGLLRLAFAQRVKMYKRTGTAASAIGARLEVRGRKAESIRGSSSAAAKAIPANYVHLVEFGAKSHGPIRPKSKGGAKALNLGADSGGLVSIVRRHPGLSGKGFMRRAFRQHAGRGLEIMGSHIWDRIKKQALKS